MENMVKQMQKKKAEEFRKKVLNENAAEKNFKWLIRAKHVKYIENEVRCATFQRWSPILIEQRNFRNKCEKLQIGKENIHKIAWLFGLWIADGYSTSPTIAVNINDKDEIKRIQGYCKDLGLIASKKPYQTEVQKENNSLSGIINIHSSTEWITLKNEKSKYKSKTLNNIFGMSLNYII